MANFPFKNAEFTPYADLHYPVLDYGSVYYTKIGGQIMAIKPIALGIFKDKTDDRCSWAKKLLALAADGKKYTLDVCGRPLFFCWQDAVNYEKGAGVRIKAVPEKHLDVILNNNGVYRGWRALEMYVWDTQRGSAYSTDDCGFLFWADKDGEHIEFTEKTKDGEKLYRSKSVCVNANVRIVEFTDSIPETKGEYTVKREFTVKATSAEEAERIVDNEIIKHK